MNVCEPVKETAISVKLQQNQVGSKVFLKHTGDTKFAEANQYEVSRGMGILLHNEDIWDTLKWKGRNVRKLLDKLRSILYFSES